ncbi:MAG TPA: phosphodiester glycosidase family protein [Anaerolineales bacterium]|jgi:hypothetical protein
MKKRSLTWVLVSLVILVGAAAFMALYYQGRPAPVEMREEIYPCMVYYRRVHYIPRMFVAHIITVDLSCKGIDVFVTPPEKGDKETPLRARTTSQFAKEFNMLVAINGDGFTPWWSNGVLDYYPHVGDPVTPNGFAASQTKEYGESKGPTLFVNSNRDATFGTAYRKVYNAISGQSWLVKDKQPVPDLNDTRKAPRTAVGLDGPGKRLIMIVVDGRQPFYSDGVTIQEMADLMLFYGGDNAINLDGGGSSSMVIKDPKTGEYEVMNSPIDNGIPGRERPVGNHFGVFMR